MGQTWNNGRKTLGISHNSSLLILGNLAEPVQVQHVWWEVWEKPIQTEEGMVLDSPQGPVSKTKNCKEDLSL